MFYACSAVLDSCGESSLDDSTLSTLLKNLCEARNLQQITDALQSIPLVPEAEYTRLPTMRSESRLIMRDGVEGGVITQSEYLVANVASEHRIPKRVTNGFMATLRRPDFNKDDIRHNTIEQIEHLISKAHDGGTIQEFNLWTEEDGKQEVMLIVRLLRQIIEDLLADPRFKDCQYLSFEMLERDGVLGLHQLSLRLQVTVRYGPLQRTAGARMFYVPSKSWTIVLPVNHILGKVPLMKVYLGGSSAPTIPHSFAGQKQRYFKRGCADQAGDKGVGSGSKLFEVNVHLWQFGRPQPRTESVAERMERVTAASTVRAAKLPPQVCSYL